MALQLRLQTNSQNATVSLLPRSSSSCRITKNLVRVNQSRRIRWSGFAYCSGSANANGSENSQTSKKGVPNSNYVVPLNNSSSITRPLAEILRDLNKRIPDNVISPLHKSIPWYHANRMLSFYAPGWCGEVRDVIFSDNGNVTVVYRLTVRGSDGEAHRESTGTVSSSDSDIVDPVASAEEVAFCRACARFGLGLYLYHEE
ncbi:DNA repair RAD52-like protein 2, chloroplastic [Mangifera indica]|uniref:DNA repair RAD52-like protein 2, chloroplastic n=1 Tax=Mangifera indica TaxID=29780 RepID=UPI001CF9F403|nr:DNA repair RAD52-like protein 2, chloroplastic [Mangifera indica]